MFTKKEIGFQLCDLESRINGLPQARFIFSSKLNDIVTLHNKSYEIGFKNATGQIITSLINPRYQRPHPHLMALLQFLIKFNSTVYTYPNRNNDFSLLFIGAFDTYLVPSTYAISSESLLPAFSAVEKLWIAEAQMTGSPTYFIDMLNATLWLSFIIFFLSIGVMLTIAINRLRKYTTSHEDNFSWFSIMTNQGADERSKFISVKLLLLSLSALVIIFHGSFEAFMSSYLAMRKPDLPFNDLPGLLRATDYSICVPMASSNVYSYVESNLIANQLQIDRLNNIEHCPVIFRKISMGYNSTTLNDNACPTKKTAILAANLYGLFKDKRGNCRIMPMPGTYFPNYIALPVSQGFKYKEHLNRGVLRLMSGGHTNYLNMKFKRQLNTDQMHKYISDEEDVSISFHQTKIIFGILLCGMALSLLVFVVEKIVNQLRF